MTQELSKTLENIEDTLKLQGDRNSVYYWLDDNTIEFKGVKLKLQQRQATQVEEIHKYDYVDLGVVMSNDCKLKHRIN